MTGASSTSPDTGVATGPETVAAANLTTFIGRAGLDELRELHRWSVEHRDEFWGAVGRPARASSSAPRTATVLDDSGGPEQPRWLVGAELNIVESCFTAPPDRLAVAHRAGGAIHRVTYGELRRRVDAAAHGLGRLGVGEGTGWPSPCR